MSNEITEFETAAFCVSQAVEEFGAKALWKELKKMYPSQYNELLYYALEELPK